MKTYIFPGQGSQHVGMGEKLFDDFQDITKKADEILDYSIKELCIYDRHNQLGKTEFTQPALFVVNALTYRKHIQEDTIQPDFLAGHSLGEYNALESAGVITFDDGLQLVKKRGELMSKAKNGAMAAIIGINTADVLSILQKNNLNTIDIANYNSYDQIIISGLKNEICNAQIFFEEQKAMYIPLNVNGAFHSRYMQDARIEFIDFLKDFHFNIPIVPVISNVNAKPHSIDHIILNLANQLTHPVLWLDSINLLLDQGVTEFIELGPSEVLSKLINSIRSKYIKKTKQISETISTAFTQKSLVENTKNTSVDNINSYKTPQELVDEWNKMYPIGTKVTVPGYDTVLTTKSHALILFKHRAAIYMDGYNGYFALTEIQPVKD